VGSAARKCHRFGDLINRLFPHSFGVLKPTTKVLAGFVSPEVLSSAYRWLSSGVFFSTWAYIPGVSVSVYPDYLQ
jgi:hypothetical protein